MISQYDSYFGDEEEQAYDDLQRKLDYEDDHQSDYKYEDEFK
jgi:hypothetical protein